jgi:ketosteroid isomerase-like protein
MEQEKQTTAIGETEKTLISPRFDEEAISHARPAVPIDETDSLSPQLRLKQAASDLTSSRLALVLVLVSMLASGVVGALAMLIYEHRSAPEQPASATIATRGEGTKNPASATGPQSPSDEERGDEAADVTQQRTTPVTAANIVGTPVETASTEEESQAASQEYADQLSSLRAALNEWIATTNARDLNRQKDFYMSKVSAFYRARNVSRDEVLADKERAFENAEVLDVRAGQPEISIDPNGRLATMRFLKQYAIKNGGEERHGQVVQELRWRRTGTGWKIISERDVKVIQ